ncbi:60 kDa jasmonate-induced protein-like [Malania oleifera]|uniref:60 kDa jasmonate-induced protein-like n=1 Tax=Malania oleifera TaxID=397392 RepID=UPI0025AE2F81|nr:60 kDa jasmonate-induced protein-like [Malania oleifera]
MVADDSVAVNDRYRRLGHALVEVFSVRINDIDGESHLYGTIKVIDGLSLQYIYDRKREDPELVSAGDAILLTGPARSISAYDSFTIDVNLMDDSKTSTNDEVIRELFTWNVYLTASNVYNEPMTDKVVGKNGSATVDYIVMSNAVQANVEITLINGDGKDLIELNGFVTARGDEFVNECMLFRKTNNENIEVRCGQLIPMSRSTIAVPLDSSLVVKAELIDRDRDTNHEIANGAAVFPTNLSGTYTENILGNNGEIQVKVTWINM